MNGAYRGRIARPPGPLARGEFRSVAHDLPGRTGQGEKFAGRCRFPKTPFVVPMPGAMRPALTRRQTMRVIVLVKATDDSEKGFLPTPEAMEAMEAMGRFNDELRNAGIMRGADGLKPSSQARQGIRV